jgi:PII-like signaling protein
MKGVSLRFFVHELQQLHGIVAYEWILEHAKRMGIHGGSAIRGIAGFGRHGILHEEHFFELPGDLPVVVEFVVSEEEADRLLDLIRGEDVSLFYVKMPVEYGILNRQA